jgi:Zn-dependent peptidase ImmA (M78 family)
MAEDINRLTTIMANHLADQAVKIRWREPAAEGAGGQTYRTPGGVVIDINDAMDLDTKFHTLLHELAHVRLGHYRDADLVSSNLPSGSIKRNDAQLKAWKNDTREQQADQLARAWAVYAERVAWQFGSPGERVIVAYLKALLYWQEK